MADPENHSLLGDILAASSSTGASTNPPPLPPSRARTELEDLLRLSDEHWSVFLAAVAPDDLVVICKRVAPAWRTRVLASLDTVSADWLRANVAALDEVTPALLTEARGRAMANAKHLLRDGDIVLPDPPAVKAAATTPAVVNKPAASSTAVAAPSSAPASAPVNAATAPAPASDGLDALFADLMRLRNQSGVAGLAALANDVPDPFLKSGLCLVAAGLPLPDLERALDGALARQAESYLDQLAQMRLRLLALARGGKNA